MSESNGQARGPGGELRRYTEPGSRRTMQHQKDRRLERMVEAAKLKIARASVPTSGTDVASSLRTLRDGLTAVTTDGDGNERPDNRERRQSADSILKHHMAVAKMADQAGDAGQTIEGGQHVHVHGAFDREGTLAALRDREFRRQALGGPEATE